MGASAPPGLGWLGAALFSLVCALVPRGASADEAGVLGARNAVGLFVSACVQHGGRPEPIRAMMARLSVPPASPQARERFLQGRPGAVFDASNAVARLALVSHDNGWCSVFAGRADEAEAVSLLEARLRDGGASVTPRPPRDMLGRPSVHSRSYEVRWAGGRYDVVLSADRQPSDVQTVLTLTPSPP